MILELVILALPLVVGGIIHMIVVKKSYLEILAVPIWKKAFGANKTLRGFVVMPLGTLLGIYLACILFPNSLLSKAGNREILGLILGLSYCLGELPNSFIKRRLGISPGEQAQDKKWLFVILDRTDSALFIALTYFLWGFPILQSFLLVPFNLIIHPLITIPLYVLGIKKKIL